MYFKPVVVELNPFADFFFKCVNLSESQTW